MLEEQLLTEFGNRLRLEVEEKLSEQDFGPLLANEAALTEVMLGYLEEAGLAADHELCPHEDQAGRNRCRITAYSLPEDSTRLELFTAYWASAEEPGPLPPSMVSRQTGRAAQFFAHVAKADLARFDGNEPVAAAARRILEEIDRIEDVRVHVLTNAVVRERDVDDLEISGRRVEFEVWDLERLYRAVGEEITRDRIEVDFEKLLGRPIACLEMKPPPAEYQTFLLVLPGELIFRLYEEFGARLFEFNVRSFLQVKGSVNKGIRKTIEEHPGRFLAYNNGLTATADEIEVGLWHGETVIKRLKGLQIVNGAQTTASIHRAKKVDKLPVDQVAVSMKLTLVPPEKLNEFVPLIARFANTQNPIQLADLSASDRFHQKFEDLSERIWSRGETRWFYERARGSYQVARARYGSTAAKRREFDRIIPKSQHFGKADLAKYLMTWWGLPHVVSKGAQKNYAAFMSSLRSRMGDDWEPDSQFYRDTIARALLFKAAQTAVRKAKLQSYGANVVTYMVAKLALDYGRDIDLDFLWDQNSVSSEMIALLTDWAPQIHEAIVQSAGKRNVTEWCKKEGCWDEIRALQLNLPSPLPPEFTASGIDSNSTEEHTENCSVEDGEAPVTVCTSLDAAAWGKIIAWVAKTPSLDEWDRKVALTLSGYAMDGWLKEPSLKQAIRGARIIKAARKAGVFDNDTP